MGASALLLAALAAADIAVSAQSKSDHGYALEYERGQPVRVDPVFGTLLEITPAGKSPRVIAEWAHGDKVVRVELGAPARDDLPESRADALTNAPVFGRAGAKTMVLPETQARAVLHGNARVYVNGRLVSVSAQAIVALLDHGIVTDERVPRVVRATSGAAPEAHVVVENLPIRQIASGRAHVVFKPVTLGVTSAQTARR